MLRTSDLFLKKIRRALRLRSLLCTEVLRLESFGKNVMSTVVHHSVELLVGASLLIKVYSSRWLVLKRSGTVACNKAPMGPRARQSVQVEGVVAIQARQVTLV